MPPVRKSPTHDGIDERLYVLLTWLEAQPDGSHEDGETGVHHDSDAVDGDVSVALDERSMEERGGHVSLGSKGLVALSTDVFCTAFVPSVRDHLVLLPHDPVRQSRLSPSALDDFDILFGGRAKVGIDEVQQELGWVGVGWEGETDAAEVGGDGIADRSKVADFALRQETEVVKEVECGRGWLVNGDDDDELEGECSDRVSLDYACIGNR